MANYNQDAWRLVEAKVQEVIDAKIAAHEAKAASTTFANSHVPTTAE